MSNPITSKVDLLVRIEVFGSAEKLNLANLVQALGNAMRGDDTSSRIEIVHVSAKRKKVKTP